MPSEDPDTTLRDEEKFDQLLDEMSEHFRERGITRADIEDAIVWARKQMVEESDSEERTTC